MQLNGLTRDAAKVSAGVWVKDIPGMDDMELRVRGLSSPFVIALRSKKERKVPRDQREPDGTIKPEVALRLFGELLHEAVLLEWKNVKDGDTEIPYDADLAAAWCTDPDFGPFADATTWAANFVDRGVKEVKDNASKNSPKPSSGSSSGAAKPVN